MFKLELSQVLTALYILGAFLLADFLIHWPLKKFITRLTKKTATKLDNQILETLHKPLVLAIAIFGLYLALNSLPLSESIEKVVKVISRSVLAALLIYTAYALLQRILEWYASVMAPRTKTGMVSKMITVLRGGILLVAGFLGISWILVIAGLDMPWLKGWLIRHGMRMALIVAITTTLVLLSSRVIPAAVRPLVLQRAKGQSKEEVKKRVDTLSGVFVSASQVVIILLASFMLLSEIGLDITPLLAGAGVVGLAIGFGAQSLIKDILNGLFIILENQYRIGDVVRIADIPGLVEEINLRRTVLRDLDGIVHVIPNGEIRVASNFTREFSRVNLNISVAYGEDLDRAIAVINRVGNELSADPEWAPRIVSPPQFLRVDDLGSSGIDLKILGVTKPIEQWNVMGELRRRLKRAFDDEGIEIPWPHTKVYFGNPLERSPSVSDSKGTVKRKPQNTSTENTEKAAG